MDLREKGHIFVLVPDLGRGGAQGTASIITEDLRKDCAVSVLTYFTKESQHEVGSSSIYKSPFSTHITWLFYVLLPLNVIWTVMKISSARESALLTLSHGVYCNVIAAVVRPIVRRISRTVMYEHSSPSAHLSTTRGQIFLKAAMRFIYPTSDAVVCVSAGARDDLKRLSPRLALKARAIHNGQDLERIIALAEGISRPRASPLATLKVVAVGRLTEQKDYPTLLRAVAAVKAKSSIELWILGEGPQEQSIRLLVHALGLEESVHLLGHQENPYKYMVTADVFVQASTWESFGNGIVEAMALGVPVIASDCPYGPREILSDGTYGILVPVGDDQALAVALRQVASSADLRRQLSRDGLVRSGDFALEQQMRQVRDVMYHNAGIG